MPSIDEIMAYLGLAQQQQPPSRGEELAGILATTPNVVDQRRPYAVSQMRSYPEKMLDDEAGGPLDMTPLGGTAGGLTRGQMIRRFGWEMMKREIQGRTPLTQPPMQLGLSSEPADVALRDYSSAVLGGENPTGFRYRTRPR